MRRLSAPRFLVLPLVAPAELHLAQLSQKSFGSDAEILVVLDEDAQLVGQVQVRLVVGRGRQEDTLALIGAGHTLEWRDTACPHGCGGCDFRR